MPIAKKKQLLKEKITAEHGQGTPKSIRLLQLMDSMEEANIPIGYWFLTMDKFVGSERLKTVVLEYTGNIKERYLEGKSLCLAGNQGTGKTMSALCILKEALKKDFTAYYTTASDIVAEMTGGNRMEMRTLTREADFLVIDEVDSRFFPSDAQKELFSSMYENVFRFRAHNTLPTIVCTNETGSLLNVFYGQAKQSVGSLHSQYLQTHSAAGKDHRKSER